MPLPPGRQLAIVTVAAMLGIAGASGPAAQDPDEVIEPLDLGLTERTGTELLFLDVLAVDGDGNPLPGLTAEDFRLKLDYVWRTLYSVDNLCPCTADGEAVRLEAGTPDEDPAYAAAGRAESVFVLYFDFSALQLDGRSGALAQARRWIREVKTPDDRAMIVAYSSLAGLETRCPLTADAAELLTALETIDDDPSLLDPFPSGLADRIETCRTGTLSCYSMARRDYFQTRRSFRTLMYYLTLLDDIPERKAMLVFHQNNVIFPGRLYAFGAAGRTMLDGQGSGLVPDNLKLMGRLAGTATSSRTTLYPIVTGDASVWGVNIGANLADFTGGRYNRGATDLEDVVDEAGRGCACYYRLGLKAPERKRSKVFRAKVRAGESILPSRYRLQYMTPYDRWERRAMAVLNSPQDADDLEIHAGAIPVRADDGRWQLSVQVAIDAADLELAPQDGQWVGAWEVGALLSDERGRQTWELLAVSRIARKAPTPSGSTILHERTFEDLKPGRYELRAFVRDRTANAFGGTETAIDLPDPATRGLAGPVLVRPRRAHLRTGLPLLEGKEIDAPWQDLEPRVGAIPQDPRHAESPLERLVWVCPAWAAGDLEVDGGPGGWAPVAARVEQAGQCAAVYHAASANDADSGRTYRLGGADPGPSTRQAPGPGAP